MARTKRQGGSSAIRAMRRRVRSTRRPAASQSRGQGHTHLPCRSRFKWERDAMVQSRSLALAMLIATSALLGGVARPAHAAGLVFPVPAPPTDIVVYPTEKGVFLSWTGAPNVAG